MSRGWWWSWDIMVTDSDELERILWERDELRERWEAADAKATGLAAKAAVASWLKERAAGQRAEAAEAEAERQKKHNLEVLTPKLERLAEACRRKDAALVEQMGLVRRAEAAEAKLREVGAELAEWRETAQRVAQHANRELRRADKAEATLRESEASAAAMRRVIGRIAEIYSSPPESEVAQALRDDAGEAFLEEMERLRRSYTPQDIALECMAMLAPLEAKGEPNTLWALVKKAMATIAAKDAELEGLRKSERVLGALEERVAVDRLDANRLESIIKERDAELERLRAELADTEARRAEYFQHYNTELGRRMAAETRLEKHLVDLTVQGQALASRDEVLMEAQGLLLWCRQLLWNPKWVAAGGPATLAAIAAVLSPTKDAAPDATTLPPQRSLTPEEAQETNAVTESLFSPGASPPNPVAVASPERLAAMLKSSESITHEAAAIGRSLHAEPGVVGVRPLNDDERRMARAVMEKHFRPLPPAREPAPVAIRDEVLEEAARIVEETPFAPGTRCGTRQGDLRRRAAAGIRALKATPAASAPNWCATCDIAHAGPCTPIAPTEGA